MSFSLPLVRTSSPTPRKSRPRTSSIGSPAKWRATRGSGAVWCSCRKSPRALRARSCVRTCGYSPRSRLEASCKIKRPTFRHKYLGFRRYVLGTMCGQRRFYSQGSRVLIVKQQGPLASRIIQQYENLTLHICSCSLALLAHRLPSSAPSCSDSTCLLRSMHDEPPQLDCRDV